MAHWISAQGQSKWGQKFKNMPSLWRHQDKHPHPNQVIFLIETKRLAESVDGLNSSVAIVAGEL